MSSEQGLGAIICPNCGNDNLAGARFCNHCGANLSNACDNCGTINVVGSRFCNNCGHSLDVAQASPSAPLPQQPMSPGDGGELGRNLASPRQEQQPARSERRVVTMLFCRVANSDQLVSRVDPEEWVAIMNQAFDHFSAPVNRYDGTIARLMGDGILAFFGAPVAHEDDPQRALLAALDIISGVSDLRRQIGRTLDLDLHVRIGINTGSVVVGEIGADQALEYTAMGDAINLAARMEEMAEPGTIQIAENTYRLVSGMFDVEDLGTLPVKGKHERVRAYRVLGRRRVRAFLDRGLFLSTSMVGREQELGVLTHAIADVVQGRGGIIFLIGEAGLGKSRLLREGAQVWQGLRSGHLAERWYETGGLSYENALPYAAFQRLLRQGAGVSPDDPPAVAQEKLNLYARLFPADQRDQVRQVLETMLAPERVRPETALQGEIFKARLFEIMLKLSRAWVSNEPMVLVVDDLHWCDPASIELLLHLFQLAERAAILFLIAMRPDRASPGWQAKHHTESRYPHRYLEIWLQPLSWVDSDQLVDQLVGTTPVPGGLRRQILEKTEGNPFFVEEVVFSLLEGRANGGSPVRNPFAGDLDDIEIPSSLQALLLARIDRLEEPARRTLQLASVIGRSFFHRVLAAIAMSSLDLDRELITLQRQELIREAARVPEVEYAFRHALTQEAAYNTILHRERREFHRRVGEAIESLFADRAEDLAPILAQHFLEADRPQRALHYFTLAGDASFRLYANEEAVAHYTQALRLARATGQAAEDITRLYLRRGRALELLSRYKEALANYGDLAAWAQEVGSPSSELAALVARTTLHAVPTAEHDPSIGMALSHRALSLARELGDHEAEARVLWNLLLLNKFVGTAEEAVRYGEEALAIARQHELRQFEAFVLNGLAIFGYMDQGELERAQASLSKARALWIEFGDQPMLADNMAGTAMISFLQGDLDGAFSEAQEAKAISERLGNLWGQAYSRWALGDVHFERGQMDDAIAVKLACIELAEQAGFLGAAVGVGASLAFVYGALGAEERGLEQARRVAALAKGGLPAWLAWAHGAEAQLLIQQGQVERAEALMGTMNETYDGVSMGSQLPSIVVSVSLAQARLALARGDDSAGLAAAERLLAYLKHSGMRVFVPDALRLKAAVLIRAGNLEEAYQVLSAARIVAETVGSQRNLWPVLAALSQVESRRGNRQETLALRHEAASIVRFIVDHVSDPGLRSTFLALPEVRAVLDGGTAS